MNMKSKLMAAIAMLLVSTVMMTTASFAWFTISTAPEVKGIDTEVIVNENLEIALCKTDGKSPVATGASQSGNGYTWGNLVDLDFANATATTEYNTAIANVTLRPMAVNTAETGFAAPEYGKDGRITANIEGVAISETNANDYGVGTMQDSSANIYGYYVDFWVRTNVAGQKLQLTAATDRMNDGTPGVTGAGSTVTSTNEHVKGSVNIAVRTLGTQTADDTLVTGTAATKVYAATNTTGTLAATALTDTLEANTATLIRVYVFLDGTKVTNQDASITGTDVTATVNLQFKLDRAAELDSMDVPVVDIPAIT